MNLNRTKRLVLLKHRLTHKTPSTNSGTYMWEDERHNHNTDIKTHILMKPEHRPHKRQQQQKKNPTNVEY